MVANRTTHRSTDAAPFTGPQYMDDVADEIAALWPKVVCKCTAVGGTANAVTATVTPAYTSLVDGMAFTIVPIADNTLAVTLTINGGAAVDVVDADGSALIAGDFKTGRMTMLVYSSATGDLHMMGGSGSGAGAPNFQDFTADGTWTKPAGADSNAIAIIDVWGPGGGGGVAARSGGGGGGAYARRIMRMSELTATVAVTVPAGGAVGVAGGTSSFGAFVLAYGGGAGNANGNTGGGGGGGLTSAGGNASGAGGGAAGGGPGGGANVGTNTVGADGVAGGASGGGGNSAGNGAAGGNSFWGGGGGGGGGSVNGAGGGASIFGGGGGQGGGGTPVGSGGVSIYGGAGGLTGVAGTAPGGGGGRNGAGGRGYVRVFIPAT